jgi:hypothetical protein
MVKSSVHANNLTAPEAFVMLQMLFAFPIAVCHVGAEREMGSVRFHEPGIVCTLPSAVVCVGRGGFD